MIYTSAVMVPVVNFIIPILHFIIIARNLMVVIFLTIQCTMGSYLKDHPKIEEDQELKKTKRKINFKFKP